MHRDPMRTVALCSTFVQAKQSDARLPGESRKAGCAQDVCRLLLHSLQQVPWFKGTRLCPERQNGGQLIFVRQEAHSKTGCAQESGVADFL